MERTTSSKYINNYQFKISSDKFLSLFLDNIQVN